MEELAQRLSRERILLELLLFKLVSLRLLLVAGEARFLGWASEEVERATEKVRKAELARAITVNELSGTLRVAEADLTLTALAANADEPWKSIFSDQYRAFSRLGAEVQTELVATRRLATAGSAAITSMLDRLTGPPPEPQFAGASTYGPQARWEPSTSSPRWVQDL
jgi:fructose-bisphosphate aldolase class 1